MKCNGQNPGFRYTSKANNLNERTLLQSYFKELVNLYGTLVDYYTYDFSLTSMNFLYGEDVLAPYTKPKQFPVYVNFNNDSLLLAKFGYVTEADATFLIPIQTFREVMGSNAAEPKAQDLIRLTEFGMDRPGGLHDTNTVTTFSSGNCIKPVDPLKELCADGIIQTNYSCDTTTSYMSGYDDMETFKNLMRGAHVFEITQRRDEFLTGNYNPLQGHYVWIIEAKRFDFSWQPSAPKEPGRDMVVDSATYGPLSSNPDFLPKKYPQNVDDFGKQKIFDYKQYPKSKTDIYGGY